MRWLGKHQYFDDLLIGGVLLLPPDPLTYSYTLTLPTTDGNSGEVLQTDGGGVLSWTPNGVATPYALTVGTGLDLTSGGSTWNGSAADTIELDITEITTTDGADRVLTSNADKTITAEPKLKFLPSAFDTTLQLGLDTSNAIMKIRRTSNTAGAGGILEILGGSATGTNLAGGDLRFVAGTATGTSGVPGKFHFRSSNLHASSSTATQAIWDLALLQQISRSESSFTLLGPQSTIAAANYDYAKLAISDTGLFTISSHDHSAMAAHITLDADGDINLDADTGNICFKDDGVSLGCITASGYSGTCATATALATARDFQTDLASTSAVSFDGTANNTHGVTGILPVANGGTGKNTLGTNEVLTGNGTSAVTDESTFTYTGGVATIGDNVAMGVAITGKNKATGNSGTDFVLQNGSCGAGTNIRPGRMLLHSGIGTGSRVGGRYDFYGHKQADPAGGTTLGSTNELTSILADIDGANSVTDFIQWNLMSNRDFFRIRHGAIGTVTMMNVDNTSSGNGHFTIDSAGDIVLDSFTGSTKLKTNGSANFASLSTHSSGSLAINSPGAIDLTSTGNITLDSAADIEINADGGDIDFKDGTAQLAKISAAGLSFENNLGAKVVFDGATDDAHLTNLSVVDPTGTRDILLPDASGTVQLQGENTGQVVHVQIKDFGNYLFYLFYDDDWYTAGSTTLRPLGDAVAPGNLSSSDSKYQGRIASYTAPSACTLKKLCFSFYWTSSSVNAADFDFGFSKFTPIGNGVAASITMNAITATDNNGAHTENAPYYHTFTFSGSNASLSAGDSFAFHMRTTGATTNTQRVLVYGQATLYLELD